MNAQTLSQRLLPEELRSIPILLGVARGHQSNRGEVSHTHIKRHSTIKIYQTRGAFSGYLASPDSIPSRRSLKPPAIRLASGRICHRCRFKAKARLRAPAQLARVVATKHGRQQERNHGPFAAGLLLVVLEPKTLARGEGSTRGEERGKISTLFLRTPLPRFQQTVISSTAASLSTSQSRASDACGRPFLSSYSLLMILLRGRMALNKFCFFCVLFLTGVAHECH